MGPPELKNALVCLVIAWSAPPWLTSMDWIRTSTMSALAKKRQLCVWSVEEEEEGRCCLRQAVTQQNNLWNIGDTHNEEQTSWPKGREPSAIEPEATVQHNPRFNFDTSSSPPFPFFFLSFFFFFLVSLVFALCFHQEKFLNSHNFCPLLHHTVEGGSDCQQH